MRRMEEQDGKCKNDQSGSAEYAVAGETGENRERAGMAL